MIKEILSVFKSNTLMDRAFQRSYDMLYLTHNMFIEARDVLRFTDSGELKINIYDQDLEVNKYQREVRKDVFNHLVLTGNEDLPSGLVLVSIVIDLERIGDYTKNIAEIALNHPKRLEGKLFEEKLVQIENEVEENFKETIECFKNADEELGREIVKKYKTVSKISDECLFDLIKEKDNTINPGTAVSLALYFRSLKRINSHLRNISSSVVNPFHRIGYKVKKKKQ